MPRLDRIVLSAPHVRLEPLALEHTEPPPRAADASRATYALQVVAATLPAMQAFITTALAEEERGESLPSAVLDAAGEVVGTTRFMTIEWWRWPGAPPEPVPVGPDVLEIGAT